VTSDETSRSDLARLRNLLAQGPERERAHEAARLRLEQARRAYVELLAHPGAIDPEKQRQTNLTVHEAERALDAASRALRDAKRDISVARLEYEEHSRR